MEGGAFGGLQMLVFSGLGWASFEHFCSKYIAKG